MSDDLLKYKKLTDIEHVRKRPAIYIGSISNTEHEVWVPFEHSMVNKVIGYNPGLMKLFDEIISNSVDEHIRSGKVQNIWVEYHPMTGEITVRDDGGIPVKKHPVYDTYIPEMIFGELRAGSNFNDEDRVTSGTNGVGSSLTAICSSSFTVQTSDGSNKFSQTYLDGMTTRTEPHVAKSKEHGTTITFIPDYEYFNCSLDDGNISKITRRVYDVAGCNPKIKVHLNGSHIKFSSFQQYAEMFGKEPVHDIQSDFEVSLLPSPDESFRHVSFVNGIDTYAGGNHVEYVAGQIVQKVREFIKKKHKIDVRPNVIRQQLFLIMKCTINAPNFTSQTKECMSSEIRNFGTTYAPSDKFIKKVLESEIVQKVLDWVESEKNRSKAAELRKLNKETQNNNFLKRIENFDDATSKNRQECVLFLTEGKSAASSVLASRTPQVHGVFPLRGKILNVRDIDHDRLVANAEIKNIMAITGLKLGQDVELMPDGEWLVVEIDGEEQLINENDKIRVDGQWVLAKDL